MSKVNWFITDHNITVNYDGQTHIVPRTAALADKLIDAIKNERMEEIPELVSTTTRIKKASDGTFYVQDGQIYVDGEVVPGPLGRKIVRFSNEGLPFEPLIKFWKNLKQNPSYRAVTELFQFLEKNDHPITDNGCFIAYKKVRDDFTDVHTGTFDNSVGNVLSMPRNQVNEDPTQTCSNGLHVANWDYANNFYGGGVMLEVEVNPANVVAVPVDYNQAKMRVCEYTVLNVVDEEHSLGTSLRVTKPEQPDCCSCCEEEEEYEEDFECDCPECCPDCNCDDYGSMSKTISSIEKIKAKGQKAINNEDAKFYNLSFKIAKNLIPRYIGKEKRCEAWEYVGQGRHRKVYKRGGVVLKIPMNLGGAEANIKERQLYISRRKEGIFAPCRLLKNGCLMMVALTNTCSCDDYNENHPLWIKNLLDGPQIGTDRNGKTLVYDYADEYSPFRIT